MNNKNTDTESKQEVEKTTCIFNNNKIFIIIDKYNNPWFRATDIISILGYKNIFDVIDKYIDNEDIYPGNHFIADLDTTTKQEENFFINEIAVYSLIKSSKDQVSKHFKKWIRADVLPSIKNYNEIKFKKDIVDLKNELKNQHEEYKKTSELCNNKVIKLKELIYNNNKLSKSEYIFILTNNDYAKNNYFKIEGTALTNLEDFLNNYNNQENNIYHYVYIDTCYNYKLIKYMLDKFLYIFKVPNTNMYNINYNDILKWLIIFNDFYNDTGDGINENINVMIDNISNIFVPDPIII
ncbi:ALI motif gene family protein [Alphaentomopoxvirus acuprea]|uniref:ALI motif gene family protein n=1 Tax=Alphaentomopoxvirus acuprea TaxID=62099 RepID=W6JIM3_9POXV|nr:ALI motif gene family protein [Anomala cuprea entomopoxvirus]BAO49392.1 ALI motif gene family protein [Anomala cuprea entomopoxvirus]